MSKTKTDAESISQDHVYATGRQLAALSERLNVLEEIASAALVKVEMLEMRFSLVMAASDVPEPEKSENAAVDPDLSQASHFVHFKYKELQVHAKSLGLNASGNSEELIGKIVEKENAELEKRNKQEAI